jgi:uncharacterized protein (DUF934 family)
MLKLALETDGLRLRHGGGEPDLHFGPDDDLLHASPDLDGVKVIALDFPSFRDGRGFSQARLLRQRGFAGDLRATGALFRDQLGLAIRAGFTSFDLHSDEPVAALREAAARYPVPYQPAALARGASS